MSARRLAAVAAVLALATGCGGSPGAEPGPVVTETVTASPEPSPYAGFDPLEVAFLEALEGVYKTATPPQQVAGGRAVCVLLWAGQSHGEAVQAAVDEGQSPTQAEALVSAAEAFLCL